MDYFNNVLTMFLDLDRGNYMAVSGESQRALRINQKYLIFCSEDEQRSYGFGTTRGGVINDIIFFGE